MLEKNFDLHQIFIIEILQVMEPIPKNMLKIQISVLPLCFFKDTKIQFEVVSTLRWFI